MALLLSATSPAPGEYYFAQANAPAPAPGVVTAQSFVATGSVVPAAPGNYIANIAEGDNALSIQNSAGGLRFGIGLNNPETGANAGSDLYVNRYSDAGALIDSPIIIERATGNVNATSNLFVAQGSIIGDGTTVGGSLLQVNGPAGLGRVYDTIYNPAVASQTDLLETNSVAFPVPIPAGFSSYPLGPVIQLPKTGIYIISGIVAYNGDAGTTFVNAAGDFCAILMIPQPVGVLQGGVTIDMTPVPAGATAVDRSWENSSVDKLTGLYDYQPTLFIYNLSGTMAATGGSALVASYDIAALC